MPSWKKVIVSGSDAALNSLTVTNGITGSLFGTSSYANYALTASNSQNAQDILIYVKNVTGAQINKGKVVRISGATGDNALIATASYESDGLSANTLGITNQDIPHDSFGYVITEGTLIGINTNAFSAGQLLYLGAAGSIIGTAPVAPLHAVRLGQVLRVQINNGSMYVRIDNGYELGELHDVVDTTTTSSFGDLLVKSGSVWINSRQLTGSYGLTGSLNATSFTGSLLGTASYSTNANQLDGLDSTAFVLNSQTSSMTVLSASFAVSSSRAVSSSFATLAASATSATTATNANTASNITPAIANDADTRILTANGNGTLNGEANLTFDGSTLRATGTISGSTVYSTQHVEAAVNLKSLFSSGDEGGEIFLNKPATGTSINTGVNIDIYQNKLRIWEAGGTNRGGYYDITALGASVGTNLLGGSGTVTQVNTSGTVNGITLTGGPITGTGTVTLGGTLSGIGNAQLTNSSIAVGSTAISLGSSATTIAGLSSVTSTSFTGSLFGTSSWAVSSSRAISASQATSASLADVAIQAGSSFSAYATTVSSNDNYKIPFLNTVISTTGFYGLLQDSEATFTWNPSTNTLTATNFAGTASSAISSSRAISASFATVAQSVLGTITNANTASNITPAVTNTANNRVLTDNGNGTINGEANLTFDGTLLTQVGSFKQGNATSANGTNSHAEGQGTQAIGETSHAEGNGTQAIGVSSHAEGLQTSASGSYSHAEGQLTVAKGTLSHAEGWFTSASGDVSHTEGYYTSASGLFSHAEGSGSRAFGNGSHAEGELTLASGLFSHAEGSGTTAIGYASHAEGEGTTSIGDGSHAEGQGSIASGSYSHAEGEFSYASGYGSHAAGYYTSASGNYQSVIGIANQSSTNQGAFIIGNGPTNLSSRSNLLYASGSNVQITGSLYVSRSDNPNKSAVYTTPGTKTEPAYTFINDDDTGMFRFTTNTVALTGGGQIGLQISDSELRLNPGTTTAQTNILMANDDTVPLVSRTPASSITVGNATLASTATIALSTDQSVTFNNGGSGAASGTTFNGSTARTISYNTIGAPSTSGTNATGTWGISVTGTATNATNVAVTDTTTGTGPYYLMFADGTTGNRASRVDSSTLQFNATTNTLTVPNLAGTASWATNVVNNGVTSVATNNGITGGTITSTGTIGLATAYGDTINPYASKTANTFLAAPNGSAGTPSFRAIVAADVPTLNQNTTGTATNASNIAVTDTTTTNATHYVTFTTGTSGNQILRTDSNTLTFNPSTNVFTVPIVNSSTSVNGGNGSAASPAFSFSGDANTGMFNAAADTLGFSTAGGERMRINSSGYVSIGGTISPSLLYLGSNSSVSSLFAGTTPGVNESGGYLNLYTPVAGGGNFASFNFSSVSNTDGDSFGASTFYCNPEEGFIASYGGLGSGTPSAGLTLNSSGASLSTSNNADINLLAYQNSDINIGTYSSTGGPINLLTRSTSSLYINTSQNIGVNTVSPETKLHIEDVTKTLTGNVAGVAQGTLSLVSTDAQAADKGASLLFGGNYINSNSSKIAYAAITGRKANGTSSNADGYLSFLTWRTSGLTEAMRITSNGDVGVGTTSPLLTNSGRGNITINGSSQSILTLGTGGVWKGYLYSDGTNVDLSAANSLYLGTNGGTTRVIITPGGAMGLGGITPTNTNGRFEASNDIVAYSTSDKRWKNNIVKIDSPLEKISQISGVEFDWIEDEPFHGNKGHDVGVIAQEIELVIPEAVQTRESGMKAVQYDKIIPLLIESIKEQQKQIDDLKELVNKLTK